MIGYPSLSKDGSARRKNGDRCAEPSGFLALPPEPAVTFRGTKKQKDFSDFNCHASDKSMAVWKFSIKDIFFFKWGETVCFLQ